MRRAGELLELDSPERGPDFEHFFDTVSRRLVGQAFLLTGNLAESQDLVQETMLRVWARWERVSRYDDPEAFARRVLHNLAVSWHRRRTVAKRDVSTVAEHPAPDADHLDIVDALGRLPARQRRAIVLHDVVGLDATEVADELGARPGTVRQWLSRGRLALAKDLDRHTTSTGGE
jgi:RNA polymerase sigma-70 factor, ECF subfamily